MDIVDELQSSIGTGGNGVSVELAMRARDEIIAIRRQQQDTAIESLQREDQWMDLMEEKDRMIDRLREALKGLNNDRPRD